MSGIDSDLIRGHIDTIILKTLFDGDKYGYEILDEVAKKSDGAYELKQPTLYSCLKRLENQGLISSYWVDSEIGGKRHYYCLTEQGKETYIENQKNWLRSRQIIDNLIWENAPSLPKQEIITEQKQQEEITQDIVPESVIDYIPPASTNITENNNEVVSDDLNNESTTLLDLMSDEPIDNNINTDKVNESQEEQTEDQSSDDVDIMSLLGHFPEPKNNEVEQHIEKLNEASDNLNEISEEYSTNSFLENFVKNYMSSDEVEVTSDETNKVDEQINEEIIDDFNLDLSSYLNAQDSYFTSTDSKDKIDFITPNVVIDNLKENNEEPAHIEYIDDENVTTIEHSKDTDSDITPTYVSFGEEIVRKQDDTAYSFVENDDELVDASSVDMDSIYINPENDINNEDITNTSYSESYSYNEPEEFLNEVNEDTKVENEPTEVNQIDRTVYETQTQGFEVIPSKYTDDESKRKITELTSYAKESSLTEDEILQDEILFDTNDFLERNKVTKNYDKLIADFEREGLSVRVHKKMVKESKDSRTYVETNKIKMTRNWISFCFISAILAIVFAIMQSNDINYYAFSYKYFVIGILVAMIIPIVSTIVFAINPYKKHVASFSPGVSFMLSGLVFVQLLLIIYCINLQLGFFSFSQEYYNHLYWIIPSIISIYPILNSIVYTTLYKSKNFHS